MEEDKNNNDRFIKEQTGIAKDKLKQELKKRTMKKIVTFIMPIILKIITVISVISLGVIIVVLFAAFLNTIIEDIFEDAAAAIKSAVTTVVDKISDENTGSEDGAGNAENVDSAKIKIEMDDSGSYVFTSNFDDKDIESIKNEINKKGKDSSHFSNYEIEIIGALMAHGLDINDYNEEELKCLPLFIKAEACTQYLDLRKNSQKMKNGKYVPAKVEDLEDNEVPGVILVQRTNTSDDNPVPLEYKIEEEFNDLVESKNIEAINYFTINDKGNLVIAKWDHILVRVDGNYPENIDDSQIESPRDEYIITTEEIAYSEYIKKYTMPVEFLLQLLLITEEPEFCNELVDYVLDSKIVINIQEEETVTVTDETRNYTVHTKDEKYIGYEVKALEQLITQENNYFLDYAKDDENNDCTNYSNTKPVVKIHKEYTNHSYKCEIIEVDTWIGYYIKTYNSSNTKTDVNENEIETKGDYKSITKTASQPIAEDKDVQRFISETKANYESKIEVPQLIITNYVDDEENKYKTITKTTGNGGYVGETDHYYEIKDENGEGTGRYGLPQITIGSEEIPATDTTATIPPIYFTYAPDQSENYYILLDKGDIISCNVSTLSIKNFEKIDVNTNIKTTITKYESGDATTNADIYAKDAEGNLEKFLLVLDKYPYSQAMLDSVDSWLFEMMEENENTIELIDTVKYLLYVYDGKDRGVTDLGDFETIFNPDEFVKASSGGNISLTTPTLSREDFIKAMNEYNGGEAFDSNFKARAEEIYDLGIRYGVNPELIVTMAEKESSFEAYGGQNYWGLDTPNGQASAYIATFEDGVRRLGEVFKTYMPGGSCASLITNRKNERSAANCNINGYGDPGTLKGMLSVYSDLCGSDTKHREGDWRFRRKYIS